MRYGHRHNEAYDDSIVGYIWKELILRPHDSLRSRQTISVSKISDATKINRTTVIRHLDKLVKRHILVKVPNEEGKCRPNNKTSYGLILYSVRIGKQIWTLSVYPSSK